MSSLICLVPGLGWLEKLGAVSLSPWSRALSQHVIHRLVTLPTAVWRPRGRRQKLPGPLCAVPGTGTGPFLHDFIGQNNHRVCQDLRGWRRRLLLMGEWQVSLQNRMGDGHHPCGHLWKTLSSTIRKMD